LKEKTWAFKTTNSVSSKRKNFGILNDNLWKHLKEKTFFHFQDTNTNADMNQLFFPLLDVTSPNIKYF
jgi:hypothetical protein